MRINTPLFKVFVYVYDGEKIREGSQFGGIYQVFSSIISMLRLTVSLASLPLKHAPRGAYSTAEKLVNGSLLF